MNNEIKLSPNRKMQLIALVISLCVLKIANTVLTVLCGSAEGGLLGAIVLAVMAFLYVYSVGQGATAEHFHPHAVLYKLTPINALATVKNALLVRHFDDKQWRSENIDAEQGTALFVCKYVDKLNDKVVVERKIQLTVQVERVNEAVSVRLVYEPINFAPLEKIPPAEFCAQTTMFLEGQLAAAQDVIFAGVAS